tara:strand:- start:4432 stop:6459 length:2028 start_codon:yes stop_codon:yes gene_type:complete
LKIAAIIQARMGSTRLPGKVIKKINNHTIIEIILNRLSQSLKLNEIIVATSDDPKNDLLEKHIQSLGYPCERGSENDVLSRFYDIAEKYNIDIIVRITGDCPFIDSSIVDQVISKFISEDSHYVSNVNPPSYPDGLDVEVFDFNSLQDANNQSIDSYEREHVTPFIKKGLNCKNSNLSYHDDLSHMRWTLDEKEDFEVIKNVFDYFYPDILFPWSKILKLSKDQPKIFFANQNLSRNETEHMGKGQKLYQHSKKIIPGGNMLLSKRPEMFLPDQWPAYFSKSKGCEVWDLDQKKYVDMSFMGIGTNILGYGHPEVDEAVLQTVKNGNMSTLNCPEEVHLIDKLIDMHPWADMGRLARTGGEANAVAIRIARAAAKTDKVAVCGYHGWHDWYLSANLGSNKSLDGHLLPGLEPNGVPRDLKDTVFPFQYNDFEGLEKLLLEEDIGVVKMEVVRNAGPEDNFLQKIRKVCSEKNIILVFDECTSGFRETFGGLHKKYDVEPDIAIFGKALGNGYAITAIIGRAEVMEAAQTSFISSTFWTERIGPTAALKTLEIMEKTESWNVISKTGKKIRDRWAKLGTKYNLEMSFFGLDSLSGFTFNSESSILYKTFITQEMLKKGYLAGTSIYSCIAHTDQIINSYFEELESIFLTIAECEDGKDITKLLDGPECHSGFKRLN